MMRPFGQCAARHSENVVARGPKLLLFGMLLACSCMVATGVVVEAVGPLMLGIPVGGSTTSLKPGSAPSDMANIRHMLKMEGGGNNSTIRRLASRTLAADYDYADYYDYDSGYCEDGQVETKNLCCPDWSPVEAPNGGLTCCANEQCTWAAQACGPGRYVCSSGCCAGSAAPCSDTVKPAAPVNNFCTAAGKWVVDSTGQGCVDGKYPVPNQKVCCPVTAPYEGTVDQKTTCCATRDCGGCSDPSFPVTGTTLCCPVSTVEVFVKGMWYCAAKSSYNQLKTTRCSGKEDVTYTDYYIPKQGNLCAIDDWQIMDSKGNMCLSTSLKIQKRRRLFDLPFKFPKPTPRFSPTIKPITTVIPSSVPIKLTKRVSDSQKLSRIMTTQVRKALKDEIKGFIQDEVIDPALQTVMDALINQEKGGNAECYCSGGVTTLPDCNKYNNAVVVTPLRWLMVPMMAFVALLIAL
eukprot:gene5347-12942_t